MQDYSQQLNAVLETALNKLHSISENDSLTSSRPGKWTCREILGHLIDSAVNNTRRFVIGQSADKLIFDGYDQDLWVAAQRYYDQSWQQLSRNLAAALTRHMVNSGIM